MRILFLSNIPSPYRIDFFNELGKHCELTVTFEGKQATDRNTEWYSRCYQGFQAVFLKGIRTKSDQFFCPGILSVIKKGYDRIIIGGYSSMTAMYAIEYLRFHHIPFCIEADGGMIQSETHLKYCIKRHFIGSASMWFSSSERTTEYFIHYGAKPERCIKYPFTSLSEKDIKESCKSISMDEKEKHRLRLGMTETFIVLTVGRFTYNGGYGKGYDTILTAAERLADYDIGFYIVGGEPTKEFIEWKQRRGLSHVHFVGFKTKSELAEYYKGANVFILMTRGDVWGLVINEAMSFGLPIISTDKCGAALELVHSGVNGYIISDNDTPQLVQYILEYLNDIEKLRNHGKASLMFIDEYSIENMARKHIEVFRNNLV